MRDLASILILFGVYWCEKYMVKDALIRCSLCGNDLFLNMTPSIKSFFEASA